MPFSWLAMLVLVCHETYRLLEGEWADLARELADQCLLLT